MMTPPVLVWRVLCFTVRAALRSLGRCSIIESD